MSTYATQQTPMVIQLPATVGRVLLGVALVLGLGFRLIGLSSVPLSYDEAATVEIARQPLSQIFELNKTSNSAPPLTLFMLHWVLQFGEAEWMIRLLPLVAGLLLIIALYDAGKQAWKALPDASTDPSMAALCGGIAALFCSLSRSQAVLSDEFRVYSLGSLLAALALAVAFRYWRSPSALLAVILGLIMFVGLQVQYGLALFYAGLLGAMALALLPVREVRRRLVIHAVITGSIFLAGVVVVYLTALRYQFYAGRGSSYTPTLSLLNLKGLATFLVTSTWQLLEYAYPSGFFVLLALLGLGIVLFKQWRNPVATAAVLPVLAVIAASIANVYLYGGARQCSMLTIPMYGLAAIACVSWLRQAVRGRATVYKLACAAVVLVIPVVVQVLDFRYELRTTPTFRTAMATIDRDFRAGDVIFVPPGTLPIYLYYARQFPSRPWIEGEGGRAWLKDERFWIDLIRKDPPYVNQLDSLLRSGRRVWLLYSHYHPGEPTFDAIAKARGWWGNVRELLNVTSTTGEGVSLMLHDPAPPSSPSKP